MEYYRIKPIHSRDRSTRRICIALPRRRRLNGNKKMSFKNKTYYDIDLDYFDLNVSFRRYKVIYASNLDTIFDHARRQCETRAEDDDLDDMRHAVQTLKQSVDGWDLPLLYITYNSRHDAKDAMDELFKRFFLCAMVKELSSEPTLIKPVTATDLETKESNGRGSDAYVSDQVSRRQASQLQDRTDKQKHDKCDKIDASTETSKPCESPQVSEKKCEESLRGLDSSDDSDGGTDEKTEELNSMVIVKIGGKKERFEREKIMKISYFSVMFSNRWHQEKETSHNKRDNTCKLDGVAFGLDDLKLLLECVENGKIAEDLQPDVKILEGLIECNDYLTSKEDSIIGEEALVEYFKGLKPGLSYDARTRMIGETNKDLLKTALESNLNEQKSKMDGMREELKNFDGFISNKIKLDAGTANALFKRFNIRGELSASQTELTIEVSNFRSKDDFMKRWRQCKFDSDLSIIGWMSDLIPKICSESVTRTISTLPEVKCLYNVIKDVLKTSQCNEIDLSCLSDVTELSLAKALFRLGSAAVVGVNWSSSRTTKCFYNLSDNDFKEFMNWFFVKLPGYFDRNHSICRVGQDRDKRSNFVGFLKNAIAALNHLDSMLVAQNAEAWFPLCHKYDEKSSWWVMNKLVPKMCTESADEIAIYLAKYLACNWKSMYIVNDEYVDFLKRQLGITWQFNYTDDSDESDSGASPRSESIASVE